MEWWYAMLLGAVQGISEFLPISSSGHLLLMEKLLPTTDQGLAVDALLHVATATAILIYFFDDWKALLLNWRKDPSLKKILLASVPAAIIGLLLDNIIESTLRSPWVVVVMLVVVAAFMWWVESNYTQVKKATPTSTKKTNTLDIGWRQSLIIGLAQVIALIPGTSRSGITMTVGMYQRLTREQAARFSFLLGVPVTLGAGLVKLPEVLNDPTLNWNILGIAALTTVAVALVTIHFFLQYISKLTLKPFAVYRLVLAAVVVLTLTVWG